MIVNINDCKCKLVDLVIKKFVGLEFFLKYLSGFQDFRDMVDYGLILKFCVKFWIFFVIKLF